MAYSAVNGTGEMKDKMMTNCNKSEGEIKEPPEHELNSTKVELKTEQQTPLAWKWSVTFLCFYGFMVQLKPGESFITPYLLSMEKNFTREQVTNEINPVLSYSYMAVLVPVFLLTDYLRYKPVLVLQSMSHVSIWLLLLLGTTLLQMQFMEFFYGITMAARVAYSSYIFSLVPANLYQRVASYSRSSVLLGVFISSVTGQLCMSLTGISYNTLSAISLGFVSFGLLLSTCLPWPKRSLFFNQNNRDEEKTATQSELAKIKPDEMITEGEKALASGSCSQKTSSRMNFMLIGMFKEMRNVVKVPSLRLWSLWWVFNSTGYYLVVFYVHILWNTLNQATEQKHVYNGGVEAASTLLGAITSFTAGFVKIRWTVWSELVIGVITATQAGLLLLMGTTTNIWVCYVTYILFRGVYQFLVPIATFQIASSLTKELCALVFGINTFLGTILKTIIILIVVEKRGLALPVHSQFFVYFFYFAVLTLVYLGCAAWVIARHCRTQEQEQVPTEVTTPIELSPVKKDPSLQWTCQDLKMK
ncbi:reduced folate transporter isoform X1 [Tachysurus vachellii]|uniref:reduced folate transporter isoform X1 n=1 Tax=Tachysurus vachellii TaxID=175792 RepID=UPI00296B27D0|nr:reduced folate transporter isoform X1 [Tachysurus vachellii]XP_060724528.1 reduced folate transporter isoform X1 [Tachysurus vachellii]